MKEIYYFGYGSNLNKDIIRQRIGKYKESKKAILKDYKFVFMPYQSIVIPVIIPSKGDRVLGAVYLISKKQLKELNKYEGPYSTRKVKVDTAEGHINALTYMFDINDFSKKTKIYRDNWIKGLIHLKYNNKDILESKKIMEEQIKILKKWIGKK